MSGYYPTYRVQCDTSLEAGDITWLATQERLAACDLVRTRFAGRADMRRAAERDPVALARLEVRLGLAPAAAIQDAVWEEWTERLIYLAGQQERGLPTTTAKCATLLLLAGEDRAARYRWARQLVGSADTPARVAAMAECAPGTTQRVRDLREQRAAARELPAAPSLEARLARLPRVLEALAEANRVLDEAGLRVATHGHRDTYTACLRGHEGASSSTGAARPEDVGLGRAYARVGFSVTTSVHHWVVSTAILDPEVRRANATCPSGYVYLAADTRVRNGRGTALVVERLTARGAWRAA